MVKQFEFKIDVYMYETVFSVKELIKTKMQLLTILLKTIRYIMYYTDIPLDKTEGKINLFVDKMSRFFFFSKEKFYSISLPMTIHETNTQEESSPKYVFDLNGVKLTSQLISSVLQLTESGIDKISCSYELAELFDAEESKHGNSIWCVFRDLLLSEIGYIRYDIDTKGYLDAIDKGYPDMHPKNHIDIFLHSRNQFKIGLIDKLTENDFMDIMNLKTDCSFLIKKEQKDKLSKVFR